MIKEQLKYFGDILSTDIGNQFIFIIICCIDEIRNRAKHYDEISVEAKHMVISRLVDRIEVGKGYTVNIRMKVAMEQLIEKTA